MVQCANCRDEFRNHGGLQTHYRHFPACSPHVSTYTSHTPRPPDTDENTDPTDAADMSFEYLNETQLETMFLDGQSSEYHVLDVDDADDVDLDSLKELFGMSADANATTHDDSAPSGLSNLLNPADESFEDDQISLELRPCVQHHVPDGVMEAALASVSDPRDEPVESPAAEDEQPNDVDELATCLNQHDLPSPPIPSHHEESTSVDSDLPFFF